MRGTFGLLILVTLAGCTTVDVARVPSLRDTREVFVTTGDVKGPYQSLGVVQTTRRGVLLFGFADPASTDLEGGLNETLIPEVRRLGGDGIMNLRFQQTQYTLPTRILFALLFFIPLPSEVTLSGEVVKLGPGAAPPSAGSPSR
ncbi:hypothetical protein [Archangium sp.]|jgi:hypothetical protein|uniref:hypothetical protein n=1 Tax=Archangium sp. TaxID=1872627 RepID=UPI002ED824C2